MFDKRRIDMIPKEIEEKWEAVVNQLGSELLSGNDGVADMIENYKYHMCSPASLIVEMELLYKFIGKARINLKNVITYLKSHKDDL